ncbi:succinate dehydrogenase assembly factor 2 [Legionella jamestowniensis]|uniref:FAD assembly factor SdhE n=1 Tax=Legionella jamestowniensis TaxID=455 RepID=A0A0W0UKK6_9GAMM|nr:succinate dehydrogenase assembly factor 2 [Legionella jamestowniensis]KTD08157.1 Antitoxin CptB [Legionella jamestowniensis]SFL99181.1 antitoxin CptB [Legionella jamestowniensis DSM 19215]
MITRSRKAKFLWHCRRGMLELDLILTRFANTYLDTLTDKQLTAFDKLLGCIDPELYSWLMGYESPIDKELVEIVEFIKLHDQFR